MAVNVADLWKEFRQRKDEEVRHQLILAYLPLVRQVAGRLAVRLPPYLDQDDLASYGIFGLMEAIERYDWSQGTKFETYAVQRIRGSMLDALRKHSWIPRSLNERFRALRKAYATCEERQGGEVSEEDIAKEMGVEVSEVYRLLAEYNLRSLVSLEECLGGSSTSERRLGDGLSDAQSPDPVALFEDKEFKQMLAKAIDQLESRDKLILALYYYEGLTLKEIGTVLHISESRVCQLHARAIVRLRLKLEQAGYTRGI